MTSTTSRSTRPTPPTRWAAASGGRRGWAPARHPRRARSPRPSPVLSQLPCWTRRAGTAGLSSRPQDHRAGRCRRPRSSRSSRLGGAAGCVAGPAPVDTAAGAAVVSRRKWCWRSGSAGGGSAAWSKVTSFDLLRVNIMCRGTGWSRAARCSTSTRWTSTRPGPGRVHRCGRRRARAGRPRWSKRDLGRVLLACEELADQAVTAAQTATDESEPMTEAERAAALALLRDPDLVARIGADFAAVGMVGEASNCLVGYLAAVCRKLAAAVGGDRAIDLRSRQERVDGRGARVRAG